jgi:heme A synthase
VPQLTAFRRLAVVTTGFAYLQIALGGVVRVSGSGLGCPDWPLCHGRPYPPADPHAIIEYSHRTVGSITGLLLIATVVAAWLLFRRRRRSLAWLATGALAAVAVEGLIGGAVVIRELAPWLVLVHLALAMLILGLLALTAVRTMPAAASAPAAMRTLTVVAAAVTFGLLLTGSSVVASGADQFCRSWPLCGSGLQPDFSGVNAFTMVHRLAAGLAGVFDVYVLIKALRRTDVSGFQGTAALTIVALGLQVVAGAAAARYDNALADGFHVALASAVWLGMATLAALSFPRTSMEPAPRAAVLALEQRPA